MKIPGRGVFALVWLLAASVVLDAGLDPRAGTDRAGIPAPDQQAVAAAAPPPSSAPREFSAKDIAPPTGTGAIAGMVLDLDKKPVRRAQVTIEGTGGIILERATITDDAGRFSVTGLPAGRFTVSAEMIGYPRVSYGAKRPYRAGSGIFLQAGQQVPDVSLTLAPGAGLTGVVYDENGEPLPGVPVQAWEVRTALSGDRTIEFPGAGVETQYTTDEQGRYRIYGLAPGDYLMGTAWFYDGRPFSLRMMTATELNTAFQSAGQSTPGGARAKGPEPTAYNYSPVFSPGMADPFSAGVFRLEAGEMRTGVDLRMQLQPMSSVEAKIASPDGTEPVASITLSRRNVPEALDVMNISPGASGPYRSNTLSPGDYRLSAQVPAEAGKPALWAVSDFTASAGQPVVLSLFLQPALVLKGVLRFESAAVKPPADLARVTIVLRKVGFGELETETTIDPKGAVSITGVIPGQYSLRASVPPDASAGAPWSVKSVVAGGQEVADRRFDIPSSGLSDLAITFTDVRTELGGVITTPTGAPATDYFVIAIPADRSFWLPGSRRIASTRPDGSGRYQFRTLPAGDYRIALTTDLVTEDLRDAGALERLFAESVAVTIGAGEKKTLDLRAGR